MSEQTALKMTDPEILNTAATEDTTTKEVFEQRYMDASVARGTAAAAFHILVKNGIQEAIKSGCHKVEFNVTAVAEFAVTNVTEELEALGYKVNLNSHYKPSGGGSMKVLAIKY